ncbi:Transglycosylase SLT domain-containing protein [Paraburkholderia steynii]|uniref:Transglycosylase SLT domain-containing protein n=1 Tax=Paraburkholderia steynii TaxID=1245441 RepID=A0A7Z7BBZ9_9BURK|nr:lytic transglycosylase domain-containing protein [Paraburkholderia steynii]SDI65397.1 Transglycosylase SLT domain-containing protein [Paraburkholderia steynii]
MPIDDLYAESTNDYLAGANQVNVPTPQTAPSTSISSIARAAARGVGQGALQFGGAAADTLAGASQIFVDPDTLALNPNAQAQTDAQINDAIAKQRAGHLFESRFGARAYDLADTLKPDPTKTTATDQIVQGAFSGLTQIVPSTLLFGPAGGAVAGGASIGLGRAEDLKRQGVDVGTRTAVGAVEGGLGAVGAVLPVAGSTIARTAGLVAVGGPGLGIAQGVAEKAILRNANYDHLADQIDPLDPTNLAAATLVSGVFGAAHMASTARAASKAAGATSSAAAPTTAPVDVPLTDLPIDTRKALRYNAPQLDAYATQAAQAAGVPPEMLLFIKNKGEQSNSNQVSPKGAKGVMQFTDPTWQAFGKGDPTDPVNSIDAAAAYAKDLLQRYDGDVRAAITEYNGGVKQAQAVHAGGAPTDPETIKYLQKYDRFAANQQINGVKFNATPEQVDAALQAHGQRMVDESNPLPEGDIAAMGAHQDAFELAARQMGEGEFPQVANLIPDDATARAAYRDFEQRIGDVALAERPNEVEISPQAGTVADAADAPVNQAAASAQGSGGAQQQPRISGLTPSGEQPVSAVEANVREAANVDPNIQVHLDAADPTLAEHNGTIQSALELIDNEHAATLDDAKLFSVAANCFLGTGF